MATGVIGFVHERQTFEGKHSGVGKANAPRAKPSTLRFLDIVQELDCLAHRTANMVWSVQWGRQKGRDISLNLFSSIFRKHAPEMSKSGDHGSGALRVGELDHDIPYELYRYQHVCGEYNLTEDFGWVNGLK